MSNNSNSNSNSNSTIGAVIDSLALKTLHTTMSHRPKGPCQSIPQPVVRGHHAHSSSTSTMCTNWASEYFQDVPPIPDLPSTHAYGTKSTTTAVPTKRSIFHHLHSRSNSGNGTNTSAQDVVARILAQDEIPRGTFVAAEKRRMGTGVNNVNDPSSSTVGHSHRYPARIDSRRALLSYANGAKAPILFPTTNSSNNAKESEKKSNAAVAATTTITTRTYLHKQLPPTPPTSSSSSSAVTSCVLSPTSAAALMVHYGNESTAPPLPPPSSTKANSPPRKIGAASQPRRMPPVGPFAPSSSSYLSSPPRKPSLAPVPERGSALPPIRPLNLSVHSATPARPPQQEQPQQRPPLVPKRLSRVVHVPTPIHPPRFRGPRAFNGPLSATGSDSELEHEELLLPVVGYDANGEKVGHHDDNEEKKVMDNVLGEEKKAEELEKGGVDRNPECGSGPLDIPVDWDDLHDRWTSPVLVVHTENALAELLMPIISSSSSSSASPSSSEEEREDVPVDIVDSEEMRREDGEALIAFQADVDDLFARSPTLEVEGEEEEGVVGDEKGFGSDDEDEEEEEDGKEDGWNRLMVHSPQPPLTSASASLSVGRAQSPYSPYPLSMLLRESTMVLPPATPSPLPVLDGSSKKDVAFPIVQPELKSTSKSVTNTSGESSSSGGDKSGSGSDSGGREQKRHGRVMVTKPVKLCLDIDIAQAVDRALMLVEEGSGEDDDEASEDELWPAVKKDARRDQTTAAAAALTNATTTTTTRVALSPLVLPGGQNRNRMSELRIHRGCFKAGESFLMMSSPLSPESASTAGLRTSMCW